MVFGAAVAAIGIPLSASAAYINVFGGPTWDEATQTGYKLTFVEYLPGSSVGSGVAVGVGDKRENGRFAAGGAPCWDRWGRMDELPYLGSDADGYADSSAYAINVAGTVVGGSSNSSAAQISARARCVGMHRGRSQSWVTLEQI